MKPRLNLESELALWRFIAILAFAAIAIIAYKAFS